MGTVLLIVQIIAVVLAMLLLLSATSEYSKAQKRGDGIGQVLAGQKALYGLGILILWRVF
jgi:hypothetical protein